MMAAFFWLYILILVLLQVSIPIYDI